MGPQPFRIDVEQAVLDDLQARLRRTRWTTLNRESSWTFGTSEGYLRELIAYWQSGYDWRLQESRLNALPQFTAPALELDVHFIHARGRGPRPMPLLLLHGWPDSFFRFHKVIERFTGVGPTGQSFDVIVPSLPGFVFTAAPKGLVAQPTRHSAEALWDLMTRVLGYERFAVAGGDGGSGIAQIMAIDHPRASWAST
jgi:hypothetical protein